MKTTTSKLTVTALLMCLFFLTKTDFAMAQKNGIFEGHQDIGEVSYEGDLSFDENEQTYTIKGSGENIWFGKDAFHFAWLKAEGDFIMRARLSFVGEGMQEHRKIGIMAREDLTPSSAHAGATVHGDGLTSLQYRTAAGKDMDEVKSNDTAPDIVQLERRGNTFIMSTARFGETFTVVEKKDLSLKKDVYVGLFISAHTNEAIEQAMAENVRFVVPAGKDLVPYQDYLGSHVEVMNVDDGKREIIYSEPVSLQAPNWTVDGKALIYNSEGLLYRLNLENRKPEKINTGFAESNNNDHVLSFDGSMLGISHHAKDAQGQSVVYILPSEGGSPERITDKSPSYLHGWSPDAKYLVFTGGRNGNYDIYKIGVDEKKEIRLTRAEGLDDGSEYSPDGKYIYFNSNRTGTMQLWRMKPDGSEQEQVTFDSYNNWFPHISPDGQWIVFLSYGPEVDSGDHPFYKQVYLRKMPVKGGEPTVIAYLYGGQGTINVPSWSPDSKRVAFVTNSGSIK